MDIPASRPGGLMRGRRSSCVPDAVYTLTVRYVPILGVLKDSAPNQVLLDGVNGWEDYVVWKVASDVRIMKDLDPAACEVRAAEALADCIRDAACRYPKTGTLPKTRYPSVPRRTLPVRG
jgi:hypothetical protein